MDSKTAERKTYIARELTNSYRFYTEGKNEQGYQSYVWAIQMVDGDKMLEYFHRIDAKLAKKYSH